MRVERRLSILAVALAGASCAPASPVAPQTVAHPLRVMSLNLCTDQLLLMLLPPARIASVTWLSRNPGGSIMAKAAGGVPVNHGLAEEVLAQKPDLVFAGSFATPGVRNVLRRLGYALVEVDEATDIDGVRRITRQVAAAVGETARGEALLADMDAKLADLRRDPAPPVRVVAWDRDGFAGGRGTLYDTMLSAAGARNLAPAAFAAGHRKADVEVLLQTDPVFILQGSGEEPGASLGDAVTRHRVVRRYWGRRMLTIRQAYYVCGTPRIADGAIALRTLLRGARDRAAAIPAIGVAAR